LDKIVRNIIIVSFALLFILIGYKLLYRPCYIEERMLLNQSIEYDSKCSSLSCLFIDTQFENGSTQILYFKDDRLLLNQSQQIQNGDMIKVQWCKIKNVGYRVRGIAPSQS
jgi:hypothetical protein